MSNQDIFNNFEEVIDILSNTVREVEPIDKKVVSKAIDLISDIMWCYACEDEDE